VKMPRWDEKRSVSAPGRLYHRCMTVPTPVLEPR
jgi:hypothetical protein